MNTDIAGIYTEFYKSLLSFIRSQVRSKEDAEDILQNVFIRIANNIGNLSDKEKLRSWIYSITRNSIIDYYRARASRKNIAVGDEVGEGIFEEEPLDSINGLDQCMAGMISLLPEEYREIIIDAELNGTKQKDLAAKYGMAYPSMRSRVQRGRERLKQLFYNCCHIETNRLGNILEVRGPSNCGENCQPACPPSGDEK
jgi:RNA polymerase sigma-70 factor, ECF subfamily